MDNGFFGKFFDLNGDGKLSMPEQYLDFMAFQEITKIDKEKDE